ncbi:MAG: 30S ribosomal protein S20 [Chloroflexi bacterium]|nr:30S ribosomal protein S20 [Chloroflexota bacterium]
MANTRSALKRVRQDRKRRLRNMRVRSRMRTFVKKANALIVEGQKEEAIEAVRQAISEIDKAAQKGVIHPNNAARRKSRLMRRFNAIAL